MSKGKKSLYEGDLKDGKRHGKGTFYFADGSVYRGDFVEGERCGYGISFYKDGGKYIGEWRDGKMHGDGVIIYPDKEIYMGQWKDGKMFGNVTFISCDKNVSLAKWNEIKNAFDGSKATDITDKIREKHIVSEQDGKVAFIPVAKVVYVGQLEGDKRDGQGMIVYSDGTVYVGQWRGNKQNGQGISVYPDGIVYVGQMEDGRQNGQGMSVYSDGTVYIGQMEDGRMHGRGIYNDSDGSKYEGDLENENRHGYGIFTYSDGSKYEGDWKNDNRHGKGTFIYSSKTKYEGDWEDDQKHGHGILTYSDGSKYEGGWKNDQKHGEGTIIYSSKTKYEGGWKNDQKHGHGKYTYSSGEVFEGEWRGSVFKVEPKNKSKPIIFFEGTNITYQVDLIKEVYQSKEAEQSPKFKTIFADSVDSDVEKLEIGDFISPNKDGKNQVTIFIHSHGGSNGILTDKDEIIEFLQNIRGKIQTYNKDNEGDEIKRIKISLAACYGDKCIDESLMGEISEFVAQGLEVRTSAAVGDKVVSEFIFNGKNSLPISSDKGESLEIVERIFSASPDPIDKFYKDKGKKYLNVSKRSPDENGFSFYEARGSKIYSPNEQSSAGQMFLMDDYVEPSSSPEARGGGASSPKLKTSAAFELPTL